MLFYLLHFFRCRVLVLNKLSKESIKKILVRAIRLENIKNISDEAIDFLSTSADGDARMALNCLGIVAKVLFGWSLLSSTSLNCTFLFV